MLNSNKSRTLLVTVASLCLPPAILLSACGDDDNSTTPPVPTTTPPTTTTTSEGGSGPGICLLNNCNADIECAGCADGRNTCLLDENRCVACDPNRPDEGCPPGQVCSPYGLCVPAGLTCPTDPETEQPNFDCLANSDCLACSPLNQVCDGTPPRCVQCSPTNTQHCTQNDYCKDGVCSPKCPNSCENNNDCMYCGGPGNEAHACFQHKCSQCNDTNFPCTGGLQCENGKCVPPCGILGGTPGDCVTDEDCYWCGGEAAYDTWICKKAVNEGPLDHGTCTPNAAGCSDLGNGVAVLPPPWSDYTNLCSNDPDCAGVGIQYNVGKLIRDLVGSDSLNIGIGTLEICDVDFPYDMSQCAEIHITDGIDCGICVPCEKDADCQPIPVDPMIMGLFCEDPLAAIAGAFLVDLLWGDEPQNNLNFFCQPIAAGYGICVPCLNPTTSCATGGGSATECNHDVCEEGDALAVNCNDCTEALCAEDGYCCETAWDDVCVSEVAQYCTTGCGQGSTCAHSPCVEGPKLSATCSDCTTALCAIDPFCCNTQWDATCVSQATGTNGYTAPAACATECGGGGGCVHSECVQGAALDASCSACATSVCGYDDYCCDPNWGWDDICVSEAEEDSNCSCP